MTEKLDAAGLYGSPPRELATTPVGTIQYAPFQPGAAALEDIAEGTASNMVMLAPPGTIERRYTLALALRALKSGCRLLAMGPKDKGGARLKKELEAFGCSVGEISKSHFRICTVVRPGKLRGLDEAIKAGALQFVDALGFWSQPGLFSWDRVDPGSALLAAKLSDICGRGADFGCGYGFLARKVLTAPAVQELTLIDIDRRAIAAARRNIDDPRARFFWTDVQRMSWPLGHLDFVVVNPPFHSGGQEDRSLGQAFIRNAAEHLRPGGSFWLTANRHMPYEESLKSHFKTATLLADQEGFKVYRAVR